MTDDLAEELLPAIEARTAAIVDTLGTTSDEVLRAPSRLPGWDRLTIACHLRYGAGAFHKMTRGSVAGEAVAYYPEGRARQRPATLVPERGESPSDVVASLATKSTALHERWRAIST